MAGRYLVLTFLAGASLLIPLRELRAQQPGVCGNFQQSTNGCIRFGLAPWVIGQTGVWKTEVTVSGPVSPLTIAPGPIVTDPGWPFFYRLSNNWDGCLEGSFDAPPVPSRGIFSVDVLGEMRCGNQPQSQAAAGPWGFKFYGATAALLNSASAKVVVQLLATDGSIASQTSVPLTFSDQASSRWSVPFTETPKHLQTDHPIVTAIAVANISSVPQSVFFKIYDESGTLVTSNRLYYLLQGVVGSEYGYYTVGNTGATMLASVLPSDLPGDEDFHGTLVIEGADGGKIIPLVLQARGQSIMALPAKAEQ